MKNLKLRDDLLLDGWLHLQMNHLLGNDCTCFLVPYTVYNTPISSSFTKYIFLTQIRFCDAFNDY